jgi:hypothetical protein
MLGIDCEICGDPDCDGDCMDDDPDDSYEDYDDSPPEYV